MEKRTLMLGSYDTAVHGWTLSACAITKGAQVQTLVQVPGRYAPLDLSTILTDGQPYYDNAQLEATLECSNGDRDHRQALISTLVNYVDGRSVPIIHPDHPNHYLTGRVQANVLYSDLAHCAVQISAVCEPWLWEAEEISIQLSATATEMETDIEIHGRLAVVPTVTVAGEVSLSFEDHTWTLSEGTHILPDLCLTPSELPGIPASHKVTVSGDGSLVITYREAVLAA